MEKRPAVEVRLSGDLLLQIGSGDAVTIAMGKVERELCRKALTDALYLLDQTIVKWSTFSTADEMGEPAPQSSLRLDGCLAVFDCAPPSAQSAGSATQRLRIVSNHLK